MEKKYKVGVEVKSVNIDQVRHILLVDDDVNILNMMEAYLLEKNFLVDAVESGAEGLKEVMKKDYDVIICDLMMPNMSGDMFYRAVERVKPNLCNRFLFVTGFSMSLEVENFIKNCQVFCLSKPFTLDKLLKSIDGILARNSGAKSA